MFKYILKRLVASLVTLFLIATSIFFMLRAVPGSPFANERALPPMIEQQLMERYNLAGPLHQQYFNYMSNLLNGDLGVSFQKVGVEVNDIIRSSFPTSAKLGLVTSAIVILIGIPFGLVAALKKGKWPDYIVSVLATLGIAVPSFVVGTMMMYVFGEIFEIIPTSGLQTLDSYIAPVIALGGFSIAFVANLTRSSMLDVLGQDYIRTAKANGLSHTKIIFKHGLKNALIPVITYIGPMIALVLTGSFVVEQIFAIPGMGKYFVESIGNRDYSLVMGVTLFYAAIYILMVLLVDIAYAIIDPRIKLDDN